jgi:2'-5' RNA ligase
MLLKTQKQKFQKNWNKYKKIFGSNIWDERPNFLYLVEIPVPKNIKKELKIEQNALKKIAPTATIVEHLHITIALPGRLGTHFQKNDIPFMKKILLEIISDYSAFPLILGDLNCFSTVIFREVYDKNEYLYRLHEEICKAIPFSQHPEFQFKNFLPHLSLLYSSNKIDNFLLNDNFKRKRIPLEFLVDKIQFGKAQNDHEQYERKIIAEYNLSA